MGVKYYKKIKLCRKIAVNNYLYTMIVIFIFAFESTKKRLSFEINGSSKISSNSRFCCR